MCGRYTIAADAKALEARFHAYAPGLLAPSYNAAPTQGLPTILNANTYVITVSVWGFRPEWADWRDVTPVINARAETVASKPTSGRPSRRSAAWCWRTALRMAADRQGQGAVSDRPEDRRAVCAGIWSMGQDGRRRLEQLAILTTEANPRRAVHNRMPVILSPEDEATWLNPEATPAQAQACLKPFPAQLLRIAAVSPR